jgi:hypothetical protein
MKLIIGFSKSKKKFPIASWVIRLYQGTPFSHIYIRVPFKEMGKFPSDRIVHASEGLIQHMSGTVFDTKHQVVEEFEFEISKELWTNIKHDDLHEKAGEPYSFAQNIGIVLVHMARWFGIRMTNPWKSGWNCSEFALDVLMDVDPESFKHFDKNTVTPKDLYNKLKNNN